MSDVQVHWMCTVARLDEQTVHANALIRALESERKAVAVLPAALLREVFG